MESEKYIQKNKSLKQKVDWNNQMFCFDHFKLLNDSSVSFLVFIFTSGSFTGRSYWKGCDHEHLISFCIVMVTRYPVKNVIYLIACFVVCIIVKNTYTGSYWITLKPYLITLQSCRTVFNILIAVYILWVVQIFKKKNFLGLEIVK